MGENDIARTRLRVEHRTLVKVNGVDKASMDVEQLDSGIALDLASLAGVGKENHERPCS